MKKVPLEKIAAYFRQRSDVLFAVVFGSSQDGFLRRGSDLDIGVCFAMKPSPQIFLELMTTLADIAEIDELDLVDLARADPILAFEAVSGHFLCKNDPEKTAAMVSLISREYEDSLWRLHPAA